MGRWLRKWLRGWLGIAEVDPQSPDSKPVMRLPLPAAPEWQQQHRDGWQSFLKTETGRCLLLRMNAAAAHNARAGSRDVMHSAHSAGRSAGFYDAITWLESMAHIEFAPERISGADADQSATSAHEPQGEAQLRELLSP